MRRTERENGVRAIRDVALAAALALLTACGGEKQESSAWAFADPSTTIFRPSGGDEWQPIGPPRERRSAQRLKGGHCRPGAPGTGNVIDWVAIDDSGRRVASGCPGAKATVWVDGRRQRFKLPPGQTSAVDFTSAGELRLLHDRGMFNDILLFTYSIRQQRLTHLATYQGGIARRPCENPSPGSDWLSVTRRNLRGAEELTMLQVGPDGAVHVSPPLHDAFEGACLTLPDGSILLPGPEGRLHRLGQSAEPVPHGVARPAPAGADFVGMSIDGPTVAYAEYRKSQGKRVITLTGPTSDTYQYAAGPGSILMSKLGLRPLGPNSLLAVTSARALIIHADRWCEVELDRDAAHEEPIFRFAISGRHVAVAGSNGDVFAFSLAC